MAHHTLDDIAGMVSDGAPVDWDRSVDATQSGDEQRMLDNLWLISQVGRLAREHDVQSAVATLRSEASPSVTLRSGAVDLDEASQDLPMETWGHLRLLERMGAGTFGEVYRAWDTQLHRQVALKLLRSNVGADAAQTAAILSEGRMLARAEHPHVARIYGIDQHEERVGLWMEFVSGTTLQDILRERGRLDMARAAQIGHHLCSAVAAVHRANVIHRDIKPGNVMIETSGRVVLTDFGAGSQRRIEDDSGPRIVTGTPLFMAPELFEGVAPGPASDVYALGVLLYQMVSGKHPVSAHTTAEVIARHRRDQRTPLAEVRPDLPARFVEIVDRAIAARREERYPTMEAMETDLAEIVAGLPLPRASATHAPDSRIDTRATETAGAQPRRRPWRWAVPAGLAAAVLLLAFLGPWRGGGADTLTARADFTRLAADGSASSVSLGDNLRPGDQLEIGLELSADAWVYVLNRDDTGATTVMFPMAGDTRRNPLAGDQRHDLPGVIEGQRLGWTFSTEAGRENFVVVASTRPLREFERELAKLPAVSLGGGLTATPLQKNALAVLTRGVTGVAAVSQDAGTDPGATLFELARQQRRGDFDREGVWLYEISLENRGER